MRKIIDVVVADSKAPLNKTNIEEDLKAQNKSLLMVIGN